MMPQPNNITIPITSADTCGNQSPRTLRPCRRAKGHHGRHAFMWVNIHPGTVREVWDATCQVCGRETRDGAVCRECGR